MITLEEIEKNYIHKFRIDIGRFFEKEPAEVWLEFREPNTDEMLALKRLYKEGKPESDELVAKFREFFPSVLIDHCFYKGKDSKEKLTNAEISEIVFRRIDLAMEVIGCFFTETVSRIQPAVKSESSQNTSLTDGLSQKK